MDTLSIIVINNKLTYLGVKTTIDKLETIRLAIEMELMAGNLAERNGNYSLSMFITAILKQPKTAWRKIKDTHPEVLKYWSESLSRSLGGMGTISYFGMFYVAAVTDFDLSAEVNPQLLNKPVKKRYCCKKKPEIYILRDSANRALKVGFSIESESRIKSHQTSNPFVQLVTVLPAASIKTEFALHSALIIFRIPGTWEWYKDLPKTRNSINLFMIREGLIQEPNLDLLLEPKPHIPSW